jgi:hypothetical protein
MRRTCLLKSQHAATALLNTAHSISMSSTIQYPPPSVIVLGIARVSVFVFAAVAFAFVFAFAFCVCVGLLVAV